MIDGPYPFPIAVHFICRECGTPCEPLAAQDRGGLCARCAFPTRVTTRTHNVVPFEPDPIRDAIDRAAAAWASDNPKDPKQ